MELTDVKLKRHLRDVLVRNEQSSLADREYMLRRFKGLLSALAEMAEEVLQKKTT